MKEENVAILATLLKKPKEDVTKALETDDGLKTLVSDFTTENKVYSLDDVKTLESNIKKNTIDNLEEKDIPDSFKSKAVGWKLEKLEGEIKEKYQFADEFNGLTDLVDKLITKAKIPNDNEELENDNKALKQRIVDLGTEHTDKLNTKQAEFDGVLIQGDFDNALNAVGLDYEGETLAKQEGLLKAAFNDTYNLKRKDVKTIVLKGDKCMNDDKFDPLPVGDVLLGLARDYGFQLKEPDPGGHGGNSSKKKTGLTGISWGDYLKEKKVKPNTEAADKLYPEWKASNK